MLRRLALLLAFVPLAFDSPANAAGPDGSIVPTYGDAGRNVMGFMQSDSLQLQAIARSPTGRIWMFGDDVINRNQLVIARVSLDGQPDTSFGPNADGRRFTALPAGLTPQTQALGVAGALVQIDGKPIVFGGLVAVNGETGVFPGVVCRLTAAGTFDGGFGTGGCRTLRTFIGLTETCRVTDVAFGSAGTMVAVGNCSGPNFSQRPFLARLTSAGGLDPEFTAGGLAIPFPPLPTITRQRYQSVQVRPDDRIVVLGDFVTTDLGREDIDLGVLQFDSFGNLDPSFSNDGVVLARGDAGADNAEHARDLLLRPDGRVLVLGQATNGFPVSTSAYLVQFTPSGNFDLTFGASGRVSDVFSGSLSPTSVYRSIDLDDQGRVVLAGSRSSPNTATKPRAGDDFWIALPWVIPPAGDPRLLISADVPTTGYVRNAQLNVGIPFSVTPGLVTEVTVPLGLDLSTNDLVKNLGLHVTADAPITLHVLDGRTFSFDSFGVLPTQSLGLDYRVMSWGIGGGAGSTFNVVASADNTTLTIVPSVTTAGHMAGVSYQVALNQGQTYDLWVNSPGDISGTRVTANKPVGVFGSHTCASIPDDTVDFCDSLSEQMLPVSTWGTQHYVVPFGRAAGDIVRVYPKVDGTQVFFNGSLVATVNAGFFYEANVTTPTQITSAGAVEVAQYAKGCRADNGPPDQCVGDPLMLNLPSTQEWSARYDAVVPVMEGIYTHFLNLVVPASAIQDIRIGNDSVLSTNFSAIGDGSYFGARIPITPGVWHVTAPAPIGVSVYGFRQASESYGHMAMPAAAGEDADSDDFIVRYRPNGDRDTSFGVGGIAVIDHAIAYGSVLPAFDRARRAIVDNGTILVGSASVNGASGQSLFVSYRLGGDRIFAHDFEN